MVTPNIEVLKAMDTFSSHYKWDWPAVYQLASQLFTYKGDPTPEFKEACHEVSEKMGLLRKEFEFISDKVEDLKEQVQ